MSGLSCRTLVIAAIGGIQSRSHSCKYSSDITVWCGLLMVVILYEYYICKYILCGTEPVPGKITGMRNTFLINSYYSIIIYIIFRSNMAEGYQPSKRVHKR